jgi:hypothetical protein
MLKVCILGRRRSDMTHEEYVASNVKPLPPFATYSNPSAGELTSMRSSATAPIARLTKLGRAKVLREPRRIVS